MFGKSASYSEMPGIVIEPRRGWQLINLKELFECRDLFYFLVLRDIKAFYAQTILGFLWAVLQPLIQIAIFTVVFGRIANVATEGIPYVLFSTVAIVPWTYISQAMTQSSQSLVLGQHMLGKVYFPRLIFPFISIAAKLLDFGISILIVVGVAVYYRVIPTWNLALFPMMVLYMVVFVAGVGMWLSAMSIRFRDVNHAMPFVIRMFMYTAPIVYSASSIPEKYRIIYSLNPLVGVVEGFRDCLLGLPFQWIYILPGMGVALLMFVSGVFYFKRMEHIFVDVI